jgi:hypothetical protein
MANFVTVIHECKNYVAWRKVYDADTRNRAAAGLTEIHVFRRPSTRTGSDGGRMMRRITVIAALAAGARA